MNTFGPIAKKSLRLVDIIDFKWLMAHEGVRVHVERLQSDRAYALMVLDAAALSPRAAVRDAALRLRRIVGLDDAIGGAA